MTKQAKEGEIIVKNRNWLTGEKLKKQVAENLPRHVTPDRFMRIVFAATQRTPKLLEASQQSLYQSMMDCSARGLEPDGYHAHLIPYFNRKTGEVECQLQVDYKGLVAQMRRSGDVVDVNAEIVYENDDFDLSLGTDRRIRHSPNFEDRGAVKLVYSVVKLKDGSVSFDWMTFEDIERVRMSSKSPEIGPWKDHWGEMAKKTVIKRHAKLLPLSDSARDIINLDNTHERPLSSAERFRSAKPVESLDMTMFDDGVNNPQESTKDPEPAKEPAKEPARKRAKPTKDPEPAKEPEPEPEERNPVKDLMAQAKKDEISTEEIREYAEERKLDIEKPADAMRMLNAWKTVSGMIRSKREF